MDKFQRSGAWSKEEERYATAIIEAFHSSRLELNEGKSIKSEAEGGCRKQRRKTRAKRKPDTPSHDSLKSGVKA